MKYIHFPIFVLACILLTSCNNETTYYSNPDETDNTIITGQVIDASSLQPLPGVTVELIADGNISLTDTTSDGQDITTIGRFTLKAVPEGTHSISISASGYAPIETQLSIQSTENQSNNYTITHDGSIRQIDLGQIALALPATLTVTAINSEGAIPDLEVLATVSSYNGNCVHSVNTNFAGKDFSIRTNSEGLATFTQLSQCALYYVRTTPKDLDGDGIYDLAASFYTYSNSPYSSSYTVNPGNTTHINIFTELLQHNDQLSVSYISTFKQPYPNSFSTGSFNNLVYRNKIYPMDTNEELLLAFSTSANIISQPGLLDLNATLPTTDPNYNSPVISAATPLLEHDGALLRIIPPSGGYTINHIYSLIGIFHSANGPTDTTLDLSSLYHGYLYIPKPGPPSLLAAIKNNSQLILAFDEYIDGDIKLVSINNNPTNSNVSFYSRSLMSNINALCNSCPNVVYAATGYANVNQGDTVDILVDAYDAENNAILDTIELTVQ